MIPPFDDFGYLPPGLHPAGIDEIEARFGRQSEIRQAQIESLRWMIDLARSAGAQRIVLNGSFTTDIMDPNDADCVLLLGHDAPIDPLALEELKDGLPFLDLKLVTEPEFEDFVNDVFATDRLGVRKGMIEVVLWN